jgi:hypothetical protein
VAWGIKVGVRVRRLGLENPGYVQTLRELYYRVEFIPVADLSLSLFVTRIAFANDEHDAAAAHDLALLADSLNAGADLHKRSLSADNRELVESDSI